METECDYNQTTYMKAGGLIQGGIRWSHTRWKDSWFDLFISEIQNRLGRKCIKQRSLNLEWTKTNEIQMAVRPSWWNL